MSGAPLRWGILGTGGIAKKFAEGLQQVADRCPVVAVGSRSLDSAQTFATNVPGCRAHGSYQALLDDPKVDVVYVALLNHQHAEWCIKAAQAGKHVLCEKPAAMTAGELEQVLAAVCTAGTFFMEGFLYRCHPRWARLRKTLSMGAIGEKRILHAAFCFDAGNKERLLSRAQGGGALMDVGCYPLSWLRWMVGEEPIATTCVAQLNSDGVDLSATATLTFPSGVLATLHTSCVAGRHVGAHIIGTQGWIQASEPWRSPPDQSFFYLHRNSVQADGLPPKSILSPVVPYDGIGEKLVAPDDGLNTYAREALVVATHIPDRQAPVMTWDDSLGQARAMDALRHQAGVWWDQER